MIATIAVVAVIAKKKKFSDRSEHSDYKESSFQLSVLLESGFHIIAIMVAIAELVFFVSDHSDCSDDMEIRL